MQLYLQNAEQFPLVVNVCRTRVVKQKPAEMETWSPSSPLLPSITACTHTSHPCIPCLTPHIRRHHPNILRLSSLHTTCLTLTSSTHLIFTLSTPVPPGLPRNMDTTIHGLPCLPHSTGLYFRFVCIVWMPCHACPIVQDSTLDLFVLCECLAMLAPEYRTLL